MGLVKIRKTSLEKMTKVRIVIEIEKMKGYSFHQVISAELLKGKVTEDLLDMLWENYSLDLQEEDFKKKKESEKN